MPPHDLGAAQIIHPAETPTSGHVRERIKIRPLKPEDFNFVISSWLKHYLDSGPAVRDMKHHLYFKTYEPIVKRLIQQSDVYIACLREDPDVIVGYLAIERKAQADILHFVVVKDLWRKMGVAKYLIQAAEPSPTASFSHWTKAIHLISHKIPYHYQPFLTLVKE